jgi:DNA phosphorothioation-associated DGQHR protein 1
MPTTSQKYPLEVPALRVNQPLGEFLVVALPASVLLQVAYSNPLQPDEAPKSKSWFSFTGTQRTPDESRVKEIARYIETSEAAFPNSIILGANYTPDGRYLNDDSEGSELAWTVHKSNAGYKLRIPTSSQVASIIDGQHRLKGFEKAAPSMRSLELLCSVYLDLPAQYQAYLFATINFNQKKVDKSLAYQLFGFDVYLEPESAWPPEKLAVFLSRRLNVESGSPLRHKIKVIAVNQDWLQEGNVFQVSTATIVEGILALISQNSKADRDRMLQKSVEGGRNRKTLHMDKSPLRQLYLDGEDAVIYTLVRNYFQAVSDTVWTDPASNSYIVKTVGIQALFDILKIICREFIDAKDLSIETMTKRLRPLASIDYSSDFFQASGKGRVRIRNSMRLALDLAQIDSMPQDDSAGYKAVLRSAVR